MTPLNLLSSFLALALAKAPPGHSLSDTYLMTGFEACAAKQFDECATYAEMAQIADPANEDAKRLYRVATAQGGKAAIPEGRTSPGFQSRMHRIGFEMALFPTPKGAIMHLTALRYNYQLGRHAIFRFGAAVALGQLQRVLKGPLHLAVTLEPTIEFGKEWRIGKVGAIGALGVLSAGPLFVEDDQSFVVRPRGKCEFSHGRLSWFVSPGFLYRPVASTSELSALVLALALGMSIAL